MTKESNDGGAFLSSSDEKKEPGIHRSGCRWRGTREFALVCVGAGAALAVGNNSATAVFENQALAVVLGGGFRLGLGAEREVASCTIATWLILPVVIRSSKRLSHAWLSINALYCETANGSLYQL